MALRYSGLNPGRPQFWALDRETTYGENERVPGADVTDFIFTFEFDEEIGLFLTNGQATDRPLNLCRDQTETWSSQPQEILASGHAAQTKR
jgi:hypothetical protein